MSDSDHIRLDPAAAPPLDPDAASVARAFPRGLPYAGSLPLDATPEAVLRAARRSPLLHAVLTVWRRGGVLTWEQALAYAVVRLVEQNEQLVKVAAEATDRRAAKPGIGSLP